MSIMRHRCFSAPGAAVETRWGRVGTTKNRTPTLDTFSPTTFDPLHIIGRAIRRWKALVYARAVALNSIFSEPVSGRYDALKFHWMAPMPMVGNPRGERWLDPPSRRQTARGMYNTIANSQELDLSAACPGATPKCLVQGPGCWIGAGTARQRQGRRLPSRWSAPACRPWSQLSGEPGLERIGQREGLQRQAKPPGGGASPTPCPRRPTPHTQISIKPPPPSMLRHTAAAGNMSEAAAASGKQESKPAARGSHTNLGET